MTSKILKTYVLINIFLLFLSLVFSILMGFIVYYIINPSNDFALNTYTIYAVSVSIISILVIATKDVKLYIVSLIFAVINYFMFISVMPIIFGANFVINQPIHGIFFTMAPLTAYCIMTLTFLFIFVLIRYIVEFSLNLVEES